MPDLLELLFVLRDGRGGGFVVYASEVDWQGVELEDPEPWQR